MFWLLLLMAAMFLGSVAAMEMLNASRRRKIARAENRNHRKYLQSKQKQWLQAWLFGSRQLKLPPPEPKRAPGDGEAPMER